jgi:hypothetical protein
LEERRRSLHARIVAAIETGLGPHADGGEEWAKAVTTLAYHAFRGGQWEQAVTWLRRAGIKAALRSAGAEAVARFGQALEALAHLPKTRANLELAMDLRFELRNPLFLLADFPRALTLLEEVKEMAEAIDDPNRLGRACAFMANAHFMLGNAERGIALAEPRASSERRWAMPRCWPSRGATSASFITFEVITRRPSRRWPRAWIG